MRILLLYLLLATPSVALCQISALSWDTKESKKLAKQFSEDEDYQFDEFTYYSYENDISFYFDDDKPKVKEAVTSHVLSHYDYQNFVAGVFTNAYSVVQDVKLLNKLGFKTNVDLPRFRKKYESEGIFYQDGYEEYFVLPKSTFGEIQGFSYEQFTTDLNYFTSLYFHKSRFQREGTIRITIPDWLEVDIKEFYLDEFGINKEVEHDGDEKIITYTFENLDKIRQEPNAPGPTYYLPHLLFIFKEYDYRRKSGNLLGSTDDQYSWYRGLVEDIDETDSVDQFLSPIVDELVAEATNDREKLENIFYWLQDNIRYIAFEDGIAGFQPESAVNVCDKRYGDCKGMANLAKHMYQLAGFDARLTWIGTRRIAYDYTTPSLAVDNHMICTVIHNGKKYFIDPTETFIAVNDYATRIQGRQVMIEDGNGYLLDTVPEFTHEHNKVEITRNFSFQDNAFMGNATEMYRGESKTRILRYYNGLKSDRIDQAIVSFANGGDKNLYASNVETSDLTNRDKTIEFKYDYTLNNYYHKVGKKLFIEMDYDKAFYYFTIDEDRWSDYVFDYKYHKVCTYHFTIPDGYSVASLPKGFTAETEDYNITVKVEHTGNTVKITRSIIIPNAIIHKENQAKWNEHQAQLRAYYDNYLVLQK